MECESQVKLSSCSLFFLVHVREWNNWSTGLPLGLPINPHVCPFWAWNMFHFLLGGSVLTCNPLLPWRRTTAQRAPSESSWWLDDHVTFTLTRLTMSICASHSYYHVKTFKGVGLNRKYVNQGKPICNALATAHSRLPHIMCSIIASYGQPSSQGIWGQKLGEDPTGFLLHQMWRFQSRRTWFNWNCSQFFTVVVLGNCSSRIEPAV